MNFFNCYLSHLDVEDTMLSKMKEKVAKIKRL